jgi:hypothetical protein
MAWPGTRMAQAVLRVARMGWIATGQPDPNEFIIIRLDRSLVHHRKR